MTQRHPQLPEVLISQIAQNARIDIAFGKTLRILRHAERRQPIRDRGQELPLRFPADVVGRERYNKGRTKQTAWPTAFGAWALSEQRRVVCVCHSLREDILAHAYAQCRSNKGAPGADRQDFEAVEAYGVERWLGELALALRQETYRPDPIRRVFIPKANGKLRPLGISTLRDRVCMLAAMLVLEPIFEADLPPELYAYRPGRNAQQAVVEVEELLFRGHPDVVDADLADYYGSIPHADLLKSVARRIVDRRVLHLIRMWLDCPVGETDDRGRKTRTTEARDKRRGIPQGSPISPLLANIYMRRFVLGWKMFGLERTLGTRLVTYAAARQSG